MSAFIRKKRVFDPTSTNPHRLSRSKVDLFLECPRCFYLGERFGIKRPSMAAFTLNIAVDHLLKKEFDIHRVEGSTHPLMKTYGVEAVPFQHPKLEDWRHNFTGVERFHEGTNIKFFGAVDDIWVNPEGELIVVDYKATSKRGEINLDEGWGPQYKRQLEFYQWLLRGNGFKVSNIGYFVYANGIKDKEAFDKKLEFNVEIIAYHGDDSWIEEVVTNMKNCLLQETLPDVGDKCEYCPYRDQAGKTIEEIYGVTRKKKIEEKSDTLF